MGGAGLKSQGIYLCSLFPRNVLLTCEANAVSELLRKKSNRPTEPCTSGLSWHCPLLFKARHRQHVCDSWATAFEIELNENGLSETITLSNAFHFYCAGESLGVPHTVISGCPRFTKYTQNIIVGSSDKEKYSDASWWWFEVWKTKSESTQPRNNETIVLLTEFRHVL